MIALGEGKGRDDGIEGVVVRVAQGGKRRTVEVERNVRDKSVSPRR